MTTARALRGAIIAAGEGSRLRRDGFAAPKALVRVGGVALIERVIGNFIAAGITSIVVIVNERDRACADWLHARFPDLDLHVIVKTTASSFESFVEVTRAAGGRVMVSTVDAWCAEDDFVRFVGAAAAHPGDRTVLGVTPIVADERPLWVTADATGHITRLGGTSGEMVTAGLYLIPERLATITPPPFPRLRDFLGWLVDREPVDAEIVANVVDIDRAEDVALAEALAAGRDIARVRGGDA